MRRCLKILGSFIVFELIGLSLIQVSAQDVNQLISYFKTQSIPVEKIETKNNILYVNLALESGQRHQESTLTKYFSTIFVKAAEQFPDRAHYCIDVFLEGETLSRIALKAQHAIDCLSGAISQEEMLSHIQMALNLDLEEIEEIALQAQATKPESKEDIKIKPKVAPSPPKSQIDRSEKSLEPSKKVSKSDLGDAEARKNLKSAINGLVNLLVDQYIEAAESNSLIDFYKKYATPEFYQQIQAEAESITNLYDEIQVAVVKLSFDVKDAQEATFKVRVNLSYIMTGTSRETKTKRILFEGIKSWILERREDRLFITDII